MRLIDADKLRAEYQAILDRGDMFCEYDIIGMLDNAPTVDTYTEDDVQYAIREGHQVGYEMAKAKYSPKTGHWIKTIGENGVTSAARCSECGFGDNRYMLFNFCPNCGARMMKDADNDIQSN